MNVFAVILGIFFLSAPGFAVNNSFQSDLEDAGRQFACPEEVVNYTCTVVDTNIPLAFTLWRGTTLFTCPGSQIILIHLSFSTSGASDSCNNGAITAESVGVEDNCFTSRLMVTVSPTLNETTIECTLAGVTIAGSDTLLIAALPAAPETRPVNFSVPRERFIITWDEPPLYMNDTVDAYFVSISGPGDLCGNESVQMVTERSYTCFMQTIPQEGDVYTFTVRTRTTNCDGNLRGSESEAIRLQVPAAPIFTGFCPDCPGLSFVDVNWQGPPGNNMLTAAVTDVCVNYCIEGNCTSECRNGSTNNPFRINNIVNGTNYTVSLSLRNDFGQSGESAPVLYENTDERCVTTPTPTPTSTPTPSTTAYPAPSQLPSQTPTQTPPQSPPPTTTAASSETPTQLPTQTPPPPTTGSPVSGGASGGVIAGGVVGGLVGAVLIVLIIVVIVFLIWRTKNSSSHKDEKDMKPNRWSKKGHSTEAAPNTQELDVTYEEVDTLQSQTIQLEDNVAYGPVKRSQKIELKENVAYGPVKRT